MKMKTNDILSLMSKGALGAIPFAGPLLSEIVGAIIPNQRLDRIYSTIVLIEKKLSSFDKESITLTAKEEDKVDLLEDVFVMATRAISDQRKDHLSSLYKNCLTDKGYKYHQYKRLLSILNQMNDMELLILKYYSLNQWEEGYEGFIKKYKDIVRTPIVFAASGDEEYKDKAIHDSFKQNLVNLGLLRVRYKKTKKGELPEFDERTGSIKANGFGITQLGRFVLRSIDQLEGEKNGN